MRDYRGDAITAISNRLNLYQYLKSEAEPVLDLKVRNNMCYTSCSNTQVASNDPFLSVRDFFPFMQQTFRSV